MAGERILVVEDERLFASYLQRFLSKLGYEVVAVLASGEEALALARSEPLDLVLMDFELAGEMNGAETASQIQALQDVPVVYITAYTEEYLGHTVKELDPYGYLIKPVSDPMLKITVQVAIERHRLNKKLKEGEEALRRERDLLAHLMDTAPIGIVRLDKQGKLTFANAAIQRELDAEPSQYTQHIFNEVSWNMTDYNGRPLADEELPFSRALNAGRLVSDIKVAVQPAGRERVYLSINAAPIYDSAGACDGVVMTVLNASQAVQAEAARRREWMRAQSYLDVAGVIMLALDTECRITMVNRQACQLLGYTEQELLGQSWLQLCLPEDARSEVSSFFRQAMDGAGRMPEYHENPVLTRSGEQRVVAWRNTVLREGDQVVGTLSSGEDITERQRAEIALAQSEERYRQLVELSPDAIGIHCQGKIVFTNSAGVRLLGAEHPKQVIGMSAMDIVHPDYRQLVGSRMQASLAGHQPVPLVEEKFLRLDGSAVDVEVATIPCMYQGKPAVQMFIRDVSARKRTEAAIRAILNGTAAVGEAFFGSLVSELANVLGVRSAFISRLLPHQDGRVRSVALYHDGQYLENEEYDLQGTPCEKVLEKEVVFYPRDVQQLFPGNVILEMRHAQSLLAIPLLSARGELLGLIAVVDDRPIVEDEMPKTLLTIFAARAAAELERLQTENSYQNIIENVSEGVFQSTPEGHFLIANPAMARLLGYDDPDELVQSISDLSHQIYVNPSDRLAWQRSLAQDKPVIGYEAQVYRKDGAAVWVVLNIRGVFDQDGALLYYEGTMQDVTERKRNEVTIQHLFEQTERRLKYVQALRDIDQAITSSLDLKMTLSLVVEQVVAQLNVNASSILLLNPHSQVLTYASSSGFRSNTIQRTRLRLGESCAGRAAYTRELVAIPDVRLEPEGQTLRAIVTGDDFKAYYGAPLIARGQVKGVLEIFHRTELAPDEEWLNFLETLARQAAIAIDNASLFEDLQRSNLDLVMAYDATIEGWSRALDLRDRETEGHTQRVADMTERLAVRMGMGEAALVHIRRGALLHDIGKMGIPDRILLKPTTLNEEEWTIMRQHPGLAYEMLHPIAYLRPAIDIPYCHHEKWDGTGYPRGLKAEQIPAAARVFAIADVWDALTSDRPYRQAWSKEKAAEHIRFQSGANFDPQVVDHFLQLLYEDGLL